MAKSPARYSILHGDDEFNLSLVVGKMRREMIEVDPAGMNLAEFDGEGVNAAEVISAVSAYPFLADRRLVIVKGFLTHITRKGAGETGKKQVERLKEDLPHLPDYEATWDGSEGDNALPTHTLQSHYRSRREVYA